MGFIKSIKIMSWSLTIIGKPENVSAELDRYGESLNGASKVEFDAAKPHIQFLVNQNYGTNAPLIKLEANGHGYEAGEQSYRNLNLNINPIYGTIV